MTIRMIPPSLVECPACKGTGTKVEEDERGRIPEPERKVGSIFKTNPTVCPWCAGCGQLLNRRADVFDSLLRALNEKG